MNLHRPLRKLVLCLPPLVVTLAVTLAAAAAARWAGDAWAARFLSLAGLLSGLAVCVNVILLVGLLGLRDLLEDPPRRRHGRRRRRRPPADRS